MKKTLVLLSLTITSIFTADISVHSQNKSSSVSTEKKSKKPEFSDKERKDLKTCAICSKSFPSASKLERHSVVHTGKHPFTCTICNKSFTQNASLKTHQRTMHPPIPLIIDPKLLSTIIVPNKPIIDPELLSTIIVPNKPIIDPELLSTIIVPNQPIINSFLSIPHAPVQPINPTAIGTMAQNLFYVNQQSHQFLFK